MVEHLNDAVKAQLKEVADTFQTVQQSREKAMEANINADATGKNGKEFVPSRNDKEYRKFLLEAAVIIKDDPAYRRAESDYRAATGDAEKQAALVAESKAVNDVLQTNEKLKNKIPEHDHIILRRALNSTVWMDQSEYERVVREQAAVRQTIDEARKVTDPSPKDSPTPHQSRKDFIWETIWSDKKEAEEGPRFPDGHGRHKPSDPNAIATVALDILKNDKTYQQYEQAGQGDKAYDYALKQAQLKLVALGDRDAGDAGTVAGALRVSHDKMQEQAKREAEAVKSKDQKHPVAPADHGQKHHHVHHHKLQQDQQHQKR